MYSCRLSCGGGNHNLIGHNMYNTTNNKICPNWVVLYLFATRLKLIKDGIYCSADVGLANAQFHCHCIFSMKPKMSPQILLVAPSTLNHVITL